MFPFRLLVVALSLANAVSFAVPINLTQFNVTVTQDFDSLATATSTGLPSGWSFLESGSGANTTYAASTGSVATGNTYSFGASGSTERAFGTVRTATLGATLGAVVANETGGIITELEIHYFGEQWRLGAAGRVDRLDFAYSLDATSLLTGAWVDIDALDFVAPAASGATGARDGNSAANRVSLSFNLAGLNMLNNSTLWLRWSDFDATGSDDGLAIDDFSIRAVRSSAPTVPDNLPSGLLAAVLCGLLATGPLVRRFRRTGCRQPL